jgi:glycosyltransferase involved in cell wall biosynthesis
MSGANPSTASSEETVSVVMPAYNEERHIGVCLQRVLRESIVAEVIIVDDASRDGTVAVVEALMTSEPRIKLARHEVNQGKGAALRTGFSLASGSIVLVQDADLEYDPEDYAASLRPILQGRADVVFGSRFLGGGAHRVLYFWHSVGNKLLTLLSNSFSGLNLTDMETGMKVFRKSVLDRIELRESRFGIEPELVAKVASIGARVYEVPISYHGRTYAEGKKAAWRDGVAAVWCIFKYGVGRWLGQ